VGCKLQAVQWWCQCHVVVVSGLYRHYAGTGGRDSCVLLVVSSTTVVVVRASGGECCVVVCSCRIQQRWLSAVLHLGDVLIGINIWGSAVDLRGMVCKWFSKWWPVMCSGGSMLCFFSPLDFPNNPELPRRQLHQHQ
jgi:hypothetical protein